MVRRLFGSSSSAVQNTVTLLSPAQMLEAAMSQEELMQVSRVIDFKMDQPVGEAPPKKIPRAKTKRRSHIHNQNSSDSSNSYSHVAPLAFALGRLYCVPGTRCTNDRAPCKRGCLRHGDMFHGTVPVGTPPLCLFIHIAQREYARGKIWNSAPGLFLRSRSPST